jgi:hypothetical protein
VNFPGAALIAGQKIFLAAFGLGEASGDISHFTLGVVAVILLGVVAECHFAQAPTGK